ncbi:CRISPR-associated endoribonuclease Cas6 [Thermovibrio ammonificans]
MPIKIFAYVEIEEELPTRELKPKHIHGLFFQMIGEETGEFFHKGAVKPFTLFCRELFKEKETTRKLHLEINVLKPELFGPIAKELTLNAFKRELKVGGKRADFTGFKVTEAESYKELMKLPPEKDFTLQFKSPTSFKRGNYDYPLPDPTLIVKSLTRKWNTFSPDKVPVEVAKKLGNSLVPSGCWIKTQKVELSDRAKITGFRGRVFLYLPEEEREIKRWANALFNFAKYAGVGRKTTMGFGKVGLVKLPASLEDNGSQGKEANSLEEQNKQLPL